MALDEKSTFTCKTGGVRDVRYLCVKADCDKLDEPGGDKRVSLNMNVSSLFLHWCLVALLTGKLISMSSY